MLGEPFLVLWQWGSPLTTLGLDTPTLRRLVSPSAISFIPGHEGFLHGGSRSVHFVPPVLGSAGML